MPSVPSPARSRRSPPRRRASWSRGENGTGKELVARAIHRLSSRAGKPFIEVNCAAIPSELIESELFGHMKGSFTGAVIDRAGQVRAGRQGDAFSRRGRRHEPRRAGQGAPRAPGWRGDAHRRQQAHPGRRARAGGDEQGPGGGDCRRALPRGPVLQAERGADLGAAAARHGARTFRSWSQHFVDQLRAPRRRAARGRSTPRPSRRCSASTGRATCASFATPSSGC